jgi:hypothetical protein
VKDLSHQKEGYKENQVIKENLGPEIAVDRMVKKVLKDL